MRMDKILEYDENNLFVRVQPGVRLCDLAADAIDHGFMYPPDPGEKTGLSAETCPRMPEVCEP